MSLEKSSIIWTAKQLSAMIKNGKINFDHIVQRSYVWERSRKSALIESMILGYPIPPIFAKRIDNGTGKRGDNTYYIMDGKQRLSSIKEYLNDEFALTTLPPVVYHDSCSDEVKVEDISGKVFSELSEGLQDVLKDTTFNVSYFDSLTKEEEREMFKRLNAGKPLSTKSKLLASCKDIEGLLDIGSHELFSEMLSDKSRENKNQVALVVKFWYMLFSNINEISFESKTFNPILENLHVSETERATMTEVFDLICNVHNILFEYKEKKVAKKLYTETHIVSLSPYFKKAIESGITGEIMADWLIEFFGSDNGASVSAEYNEAAGSGSAKAANIQARNAALYNSYSIFFTEDSNSEEGDNDVTN